VRLKHVVDRLSNKNGVDVKQQWEEPGCFEVAPNVYRIPLPLPNDGLRAVNVYAIVDGSRLVMIDSGQHLAQARLALERALTELNAKVGDIGRFLVTHIHRDHYTQAVAVRKEFGSQIALGTLERESMSLALNSTRTSLKQQLRELERNGAGCLVRQLASLQASQQDTEIHYEAPDSWLEEGIVELTTRALRVISTPGHTRGHVVFFDEDNSLLFAGDHVLPHITPSIGFEPAVYANPLGAYLNSLNRIRHLPSSKLLPAHGSPAEDFHWRIDELLGHHKGRLTATRAVLGNRELTAYEVARELRWTRRERNFDELDVFNQMLAVMETKFHLALLRIQGHLRESTREGIVFFSLPTGLSS